MKKNIGGNSIYSFKKKYSSINLHKSFVNYDIIFLKKDKLYEISNNSKILVNVSKKGKILVNNFHLKPQEYMLSNGTKLNLLSKNHDSVMIIVSSKNKDKKIFLKKKNIREIKKVKKPWGYEWWYEYENLGFAFKKIFIKKNFKTSLQYHLNKKEINLLFQGIIKLHYKKNKKTENKNVKIKDVSNLILKNFTSIFVKPKTLHRIEALTDIILYEASTLQLNDVIRVSDDTNRPNGKIDNEHSKSM